MMLEDDILIEQFLRNELSDSARASFLERMESDASFKEQVDLEAQLLNVLGDLYWSFATNDKNARVEAYKKILESKETEQLKTTIAKTIEEYKQNSSDTSSSRISKLNFILRIAAVFLIFFVAIFWYFSNNSQIDYSELTAQAWNKNVGLDFTVRNNTSDSTKMALEKALQYYSHKKYDQTLLVLKQFNHPNTRYKDVLLMRALAYYRLQKPQVALKTLDSLESYAPDISKWYQGLIYLDQHQLEKASLFLEIPIQPDQEIKLKH